MKGKFSKKTSLRTLKNKTTNTLHDVSWVSKKLTYGNPFAYGLVRLFNILMNPKLKTSPSYFDQTSKIKPTLS